MDPSTVAEMLAKQIESRQLAPSEARALFNRQPFTPEQESEFDRLFPTRAAQPTTTKGA